LTTAITRVAKQNIPAVVHVDVTERQIIANPLIPFEDSPLFRYFFGNPKKIPEKFQREILGLGSGMIIDAEGHMGTSQLSTANMNRAKVEDELNKGAKIQA